MTTSKTLLAMCLMTALGCASATLVSAGITTITPSKDNTLYEYDPAEGDHSNGAGSHFFAGENGMGEIRRGVSHSTSREAFQPARPSSQPLLALTCREPGWTLHAPSSCTSCSQTGVKELPSRPERKATARRLRRVMPYGDTASLTQIFWTNEGSDFSPQSVPASQSVLLDISGLPLKWSPMCNGGWTIRPATSAG